MVWIKKNIVTVDVLYYMPDFNDIVQEFIWQTPDITPELPRVHKFLNHWHKNIDAVIKEVQVSYSDHHQGYRAAEIVREINVWH
tara:strand:+ start:1907 stop:2158 length:252 start_codon:yes stop_codon:yes gene_type:complete